MKKILILIFTCLISSQALIFSQQKVWSLEECIKYAIDNNIQIKQQGIQTEIQKNSLDLAKFLLLPSLNGQASHSYSFGRALDQNTYTFFNQTLQSDYFYLGGSMPVSTAYRITILFRKINIRFLPVSRISRILVIM